MSGPFTADITGWLLVFARVAAILMLLPGFGDEAVPARVKLIFALLLALVVYPAVLHRLPEVGAVDPLLAPLVIREVLIGLMMGAIVRILYSAIATAGTIISTQSGLAMAVAFDPSLGAQNQVLTRFMSMAAIVLIFALNVHHLLIAAVVRSYTVFAPDGKLMLGDVARLAIEAMAQSFAIGVQLAGPFLLYGFIFNAGLGLIARLTPAMQVFFVAQPLNLLFAFGLLIATMGLTLSLFIRFFTEAVRGLMG